MFLRQRATLTLLGEGSSLARRFYAYLVLPLITAWLWLMAGIVLWLLAGFGVLPLWHRLLGATPVWLDWIVFVGSNLPGMVLFIRGMWRFAIRAAAMHLLIRDVANAQPPERMEGYILRLESRSVDFALLWCVAYAVLFVALALAALLLRLSPTTALHGPLWMILLDVGLLLGALRIWLGMAFVFPVLACTPANAGAVLFRSHDLVRTQPIRVLSIAGASLGVLFLLAGLVLYGWYALQPMLPLAWLFPTPAAQLTAIMSLALGWVFGSLAFALPVPIAWLTLLYADARIRLTLQTAQVM